MKLFLPPMFENNHRNIDIIDNVLLIDVLKNHLGEDFRYFFDSNKPQGYIQFFLNGKQIQDVNNLYLKNHDNLEIITPLSGG